MGENENLRDRLLSKIEEKKLSLDLKKLKYYKLDLLSRIINRLDSYKEECPTCTDYLGNLETYIDGLQSNTDKKENNEYHLYLNSIVSHLQHKHRLVSDSYYISVFLPLGLVFGSVLSIMNLFGNNSSSIGIAIGLCIGVAIGASKDAEAKKQGKVI